MTRLHRTLPLLLVILLPGCIPAAPAAADSTVLQVKRGDSTITIGNAFADNGVFRLQRNDVAIVSMDSSWLFSKGAFERLGAYKAWTDSIQAIHRNLLEHYEAERKKSDSLLMQYRAMDSIQTMSFDSLLLLNSRLDTALSRSIANTDKAVEVAKRLRWQSYLTSTLIGAVAGYAIQDRWYGLAGGAGAGILLNMAIMEISF